MLFQTEMQPTGDGRERTYTRFGRPENVASTNSKIRVIT